MDEQNATTTPAPAPLGGILESLLSNPDLMQKIGGLMQSVQEGKDADAPPSAPAAQTSAPLGDGLGALLSDSALLQNIPRIMSMLKPLMSAQSAPTAPAKSNSPACHRDNLLLALKPFLSTERQSAVDTILRLSRLGSVFRQLQ